MRPPLAALLALVLVACQDDTVDISPTADAAGVDTHTLDSGEVDAAQDADDDTRDGGPADTEGDATEDPDTGDALEDPDTDTDLMDTQATDTTAVDSSIADTDHDAPETDTGATDTGGTDVLEDTDVGDTGASDTVQDPIDDAETGPYVPTVVTAERIFTGPAGVRTPPTWNANLPKLVGDGEHYYAVHTHYTPETGGRFAAILSRPVDGGSWAELARISAPHQPPGLVMDAGRRLHVFFDCLRPGAEPTTCFQGGAGTGPLVSRFYHLIFSARDGSGILRFNTYANHNDYTAESNGYMGAGTTADGTTWWSLAATDWSRVVQAQSGGGTPTTIDTLNAQAGVLLYPIMSASAEAPDELVLYAGEFDPGVGDNAAYLGTELFAGSTGGLDRVYRRIPDVPDVSTTAAYPSDVAFDEAGVAYVLTYLPQPDDTCTELWRFDPGLAAAPERFVVGCASTYAKLQFASDGTLYLITPAGASLRVGYSTDRGETWGWETVPIEGITTSDERFFGYTPIRADNAPLAYDPDVFRFFFSGYDASGNARHSYFGELALAEP